MTTHEPGVPATAPHPITVRTAAIHAAISLADISSPTTTRNILETAKVIEQYLATGETP